MLRVHSRSAPDRRKNSRPVCDSLCQGEQDSRPAHGKKRPDQFHPHRGGGSQHRSQQKHRLPDKAVGAGRQKAAEQPILHLCKKGGEEE